MLSYRAETDKLLLRNLVYAETVNIILKHCPLHRSQGLDPSGKIKEQLLHARRHFTLRLGPLLPRMHVGKKLIYLDDSGIGFLVRFLLFLQCADLFLDRQHKPSCEEHGRKKHQDKKA